MNTIFGTRYDASAIRKVGKEIIRNYNAYATENNLPAFNHRSGDGSGFGVQVEGFMPLSIATLTPTLLSVYHFYLQNGDLMYDPEIVFFINDVPDRAAPEWIPFSYTQSGLNVYREYITLKDGKPHKWFPRGVADTKAFCVMWAENLKAQGFTSSVTFKPH